MIWVVKTFYQLFLKLYFNRSYNEIREITVSKRAIYNSRLNIETFPVLSLKFYLPKIRHFS